MKQKFKKNMEGTAWFWRPSLVCTFSVCTLLDYASSLVHEEEKRVQMFITITLK